MKNKFHESIGVAIICVICFIVSPNLTVFAVGDNVGETIGFAEDIFDDAVRVVGEPLTASGYSSAYVSIGNAPVYDLLTGLRVDASEIYRGTEIRVAYDTRRGVEPFPAIVVWLNWGYEDAAVFTVVVSDNIRGDGDSTVFLCADEKYRVSLDSDTIIFDPHLGFLSHDNIRPGMEFFVWVDMITASTPALVFPEKVVVVH
ncbi:MAG: hypothetical protein FWF79_03670 [Defluviitaleaceae bacterium]|nr:hypothetical protein [Defluviitaleaceae bacterium]